MKRALAKLNKMMGQFDREQPFCPATQAQVALLQQECLERFGVSLPQGYPQLLSITDGFIWNGLTVFASEPRRLPLEREVMVPSFIEENEGLRLDRPDSAGWLVFGQNDLDYFLHRISDGAFLAVSILCEDEVEHFSRFETMMTSAIERAL